VAVFQIEHPAASIENDSMSVTLFTSPRFGDHLTPPGHPERIERIEVMQAVASAFRKSGGDVREPHPATREALARVHQAEYIGLIAETAGRATALDADTFTSPDTYDVACLAAGAAIDAVDLVLDGAAGPLPTDAAGPRRGSRPTGAGGPLAPSASPGSRSARAFALVRPPGHHAEADRAMGFCFFNNVAIAAAHARARGLSRVAIVDYDVHHGNGTQWAFYTDPSVLFISSHQYPYYPGTGAATEIGSGEGTGFTINLPLSAGATDADYALVYARVAVPALHQFEPELILISAGYDAYLDDPLGGMRLSSACFGRLTSMIVEVADRHCAGRVVAVTEGGYNLQGLADGLQETIAALDAEGADQAGPTGDDSVPTGDTSRGETTMKAVLPAIGSHWQL
jgi:acetoin utilization deacetylase AcuC-like enzyme